MDLIADKDGVDVILAPVTGLDGVQVNIDFNFSAKHFHELDNRAREWDLKLMDGKRHVGNAKFAAYQFMSDGLERRTITLRNLTLQPRHRGQKKSYDLAQFVVDTVRRECDRDWGEVYGNAVLFIEKRDLGDMPDADRNALFAFLRKIGERIFGFEGKGQSTGGDLSVSVIGDNVTIQLIQAHLLRSNRKRK